jgi:hypothetical protein
MDDPIPSGSLVTNTREKKQPENKKVKKSLLKHVAAAAVTAAFAVPAFAANIVLVDSTNSFAKAPNGAEALFAFQKAANYWNKTLSNDVNIRIDIGFEALKPGVLGSTRSFSNDASVASVYGALAKTGTSALDSIAVSHLSALDAHGNLSMRVSSYLDPVAQTGIDTAASRLSTGDSVMNRYLSVNTATLKALHLSTGQAANAADASIKFSSNFGFDFNPTDGVSTGKYDFVAVATHEIGHALGFVSGADIFDEYGHPGSPYAKLVDADHIDDYSIGSTLDLFRYGNGLNKDGSRQLQWASDRDAFFSIDGQNIFNLTNPNQVAATFSTGEYNGDKHQASHWSDNKAFVQPNGCYQSTKQIGIMDPTAAACEMGIVTQNDLAAFDAMGWNLHENILQDPSYAKTTADIYNMDGVAVASVPEPETYAMLLAGLGLTGFMARRRKNKQA